jgi:hypothetical protein
VHELHAATRAVAALLHLAAVGVEDTVTKVRAGDARPLQHQDLVAAHAEVAIRDASQLLAGKGKRLLRGVDDDEVVARAVHLGECKLHPSPA